jgi:dipicolinate synthase subunit A
LRGDIVSAIKYAVLGGDLRYKILCELLQKDGYSVNCFANQYKQNTVNELDKLLTGADILVAPIPFSKDNKNVFLPVLQDISIDGLLYEVDKVGCRALVGGVMGDKPRENSYGIKVYDFFDMEEVAVLNAIPTAEGAIQTAMQESERTLFGSKAVVLGYGRCGKILANMLKGMGADVSATYRKNSDRAYITAYGIRAIAFNELLSYINEFSFIFNTIPSPVLNKDMLRRVAMGSVIIDIAQAPGGTDFAFASALNLKALYCPSLPGRVAPYTAAEVLKGALINIAVCSN